METINASDNKMELGVMDYRKWPNVKVTEDPDKDTFTVTLELFLRVTAADKELTDEKKKEILIKWCAKWDAEKIGDNFNSMYEVYSSRWVEPGVFEMTVKRPSDYHHPELAIPVGDMKELFVYDCLEDTLYEGGVDNNFWCLPMSEA